MIPDNGVCVCVYACPIVMFVCIHVFDSGICACVRVIDSGVCVCMCLIVVGVVWCVFVVHNVLRCVQVPKRDDDLFFSLRIQVCSPRNG